MIKKVLVVLMIGLISAFSIAGAKAADNPVTSSSDSGSEMALFEDIPVVTTAAGREQKLDDVANAMYVITQEDIERSGAREVVDLLYRVPGLQVRQIDGHNYGVGIREGGAFDTNNLLVLVDGAVVFNPIFGGTLWENLPVSLNEIERIEIIRGSPGVLYSSNAANGVINIITKSADTKNNYIQQEGGTQSYRDSSIGLGLDKISTTGLAIRAYLDNQFDQGFPKNTTGSFSDRYLSDRDGGRIDYTPTDNQRLSVIANNNQQNSISPNPIFGTYSTKTPGETTSAIINYTNKVTDMYDFSFHFDHVEQIGTAFIADDAIDHTTSVTTQHNFHYDLLGSHVSSIGGELRYNDLHVAENQGIMGQGLLSNGQASQKIISFFAQDEYRPIEKLILTAGVRENSNSLVINEKPLYSPKFSALYHLTDNQSIWISSAKDYRTPSFSDHDLSLTLANPVLPFFPGAFETGSANLKPEEDFTQEMGYRGLLLDQKLKVDADLFLTTVKDEIVVNTNPLTGNGTTFNDGNLTSEGAELNLDYSLTQDLSLTTDYSYIYPHSKPETANNTGTLDLDSMASENIAGMGMRYTKDKIKLDLYEKYFEGYEVQEVGNPNVKIRAYYKTFMRVSYDFKTPRWMGDLDSTVYLSVNDAIGARKIESNTFSNEIFIKPEVTSGIKVAF